jgi:hypothetical protein
MRTRYGKTRQRRKQGHDGRRRGQRQACTDQRAEEIRRELQLSFDEEEILALLQDSLDNFAIEVGRRVAVGLW